MAEEAKKRKGKGPNRDSSGPDMRLVQLDIERNAWVRKLRTDRPAAEAEAMKKLRELKSSTQRNYTQDDLARAYSQMMNGAATPADFTPSRRA